MLVNAVQTAITVSVEASTWESNSALVEGVGYTWYRGGVGLAFQAADLALLVRDSIFRNNSIWGQGRIMGGAVAVQTDSSMENVVEVTLLDNLFDGNSVGSNGHGASLATLDDSASQPALSAPGVVLQRNVFRNSHAGQQKHAHQHVAASD